MIGTSVNGGDIYGTLPHSSWSGPDLRTQSESGFQASGIDQYGAALASWYGLKVGATAGTVFTNLSKFSGPIPGI